MSHSLEPLRLRDIRQISTFRLTTLFGVVFLVALCTLLGLIYSLTASELTHRSDQVLIQESGRLNRLPADELPARVDAAIANSASGLNYFALVRPDGRLMTGNIALPPGYRLNQPFELASEGAARIPLRVLVVRVPRGDLLVVGRDITQIRDFRRWVLTILFASGLAAVGSVLIAGTLLSVGPLRRIQRLKSVAGQIAAGDLRLRMPISRRGDELDLIAATVNSMVEEIERLMVQVKGVTDAIAHDLRTPLSHLRTRLFNLQRQITVGSREGDSGSSADPQFGALVDAAIDDLDIVLTRFGALLRISELEASNRRAGFGTLDPMALLSNVAELFEPLAEERGIQLGIAGRYGQFIEGDETLLFEAVSNLLDNAIKFIHEQGSVTLEVARLGPAVTIEVRDNGPGISMGERQAVLRRCHRGEAAGQVPGSGLGLSLVAVIAHLHGFELELEDAGPGLIVRIHCSSSPGEANTD